MIEEALAINRETIRSILHEDLGKRKVCARFVPRELTEEQKGARLQHCRDLIETAKNDLNFVKTIVTGDETWCFQYGPESKRQSAIWKSPKVHQKLKKHEERLQKSRQCSLLYSIANKLFTRSLFQMVRQLLQCSISRL